MEIKSGTPASNQSQIKQTPTQKIETETVKTNSVDTVTISAEAQALSGDVSPLRAGGVIVVKPT